jgi:hypothetical protein
VIGLRSLCLLLILFGCKEQRASERETVCRPEVFFLAEDVNGQPVEIVDARRGVLLSGDRDQIQNKPTHIIFRSRSAVTIEWLAFGHLSTQTKLEYSPELSKARVVDPQDGGVTSYPMLVEGMVPKSVTLAFASPLCGADSPSWMCMHSTKETLIFGTFACVEEQAPKGP